MSTADPAIPAPAAEALRERASSQWMDRASDWFNPILVKEVRQSLKSRQFVVTFMLLLVGAWLVSFLSIMWMGNAIEYGAVAPDVFWWYYFVLAFAMFVIVPFTAFRSLLAERDENTYDLLSITTLAPREIVRGKLLSSLVQLFIFYSAVAPFIAFTSMLKGFSWPEVIYVLVLSLLVSVLACAGCLMASTLVRSRTWQGLMSLALLVGLFGIFLTFTVGDFADGGGIAGAIVDLTLDQSGWFWCANGVAVLVAGSYFVLFQQVTAAQLTFEAGNRSTGIRITCFAQIWLVWCGVFGFLLYISTAYPGERWTDLYRLFRELAPPLTALSLVHVAAIGLFASSENEKLSHRVSRSVPTSGPFKVLATPWLPGCGRGFAYTLLCLASLFALVVTCSAVAFGESPLQLVVAGFDGTASREGRIVQFALVGCSYVAIYSGLGCLLSRLFGGVNEVRSAHVRVVVLLSVLFAIIVPYMLRSFGLRAFDRYSLLIITVPFDTMGHVLRGGDYAGVATTMLLFAASLVTALNVPALAAGFGEILTTDARRLRRIHDARHAEPGAEDEIDVADGPG